MKKFLLGLVSFVLVVGSLSAQDAKKALKSAKKAYAAYNLDAIKNADKLQEAIDALNIAAADDAVGSTFEYWKVRGDLYNTAYRKYAEIKLINPAAEKSIADAAVQAFTSFEKAAELAQKKYEKKEVQKSISQVQSYLVGEGADLYEKQDYAGAYVAFNAALEAHDLLKEKGSDSMFDEAEAYNDQMYYTGLAALNAQDLDAAKPVFMKLKDAGYAKPAVYEALYKLALETDREEALAVLDEGREKFPDDVSLLFNEINHYLQDGKLDILTGKLEKAIEKEPNNPSLYSTLGNVYDNLYQKELADGNEAKSTEYFDAAYANYNKALELKPGFFDAVYSIGALYYNRAASTTAAMNALADDYSKPGLAKYEALRATMLKQFDEALPFFKQAEGLNPNDRNTLIALKEIFARKDDLKTSSEFKSRLDTIEGGGTIESSYFNK